MHRKSRLTVFFYLFLTFTIPLHQAHSQAWIQGIKATGSDQTSGLYDDSDMAVDTKGNIVIAGQYNNAISFGDHTISTDNGFYPDIFLCRIGADRTVQWLKHIETGFNNAEELAISIDDDSNIYLTGNIDGYIFVSKYDSTGALIWSQDFEKEFYGYGTALKTDMYDNVYVSGGSGWNFFMAKLSSFGDVEWVKDIWVNYSDGCTVTDIAVDAIGNIYFAGRFGINLPLGNITLPYTNSWGPNVFWGHMDSRGEFIWAKSASGRSTDRISIALTSDKHLFLVGGVSGSSVNFDGYDVPRGNCCNGASTFVAKSDLDGTILWAKPGTDNYYGSHAAAIQIDHNSNLYVTGTYFTCYGTFCTEGDFYVEKYDKEGTPIWRKDFESTNTENTKAIDIDNHGLMYVLGVNSSASFVDPSDWSPVRTYGVGILDTESSTYKGTPRPRAENQIIICDGDENSGTKMITAEGENIRWYNDESLSNKIADGNTFSVNTTKSDTIFLTQTVNTIESWPKAIIIRLISLPQDDLILENDKISAPVKDGIHYQWFYNNTPIPNATDYYVDVDTTQNYDRFSVLLTQASCQKLLTEIKLITSIEESGGSLRIAAYPNPTSSTVVIPLNNVIVSDIGVYDVLGKRTNATVHSSEHEIRIDLSDAKPGLYVVNLLLNHARRSLKVIKR